MDVGALANQFTQLRHVTVAGGSNKLFGHLFRSLCLAATLPHYSSTKVSTWGEREPIPTQFCARRERRFPEQFSIDVDENRLRCALLFPPRQRPAPLSARLR